MKPRNTLSRAPSMPCPHCGEKLIVRTSHQVAPTVRDMQVDCGGCGFSCVAQLSLTLVRRAPDVANPEIRLPFSANSLRSGRPRPANDDAPLPANDDGIEVPAVAGCLPARPG